MSQPIHSIGWRAKRSAAAGCELAQLGVDVVEVDEEGALHGRFASGKGDEMVSQNVTLGPVREVWLPAGGVLANLLSGNDRQHSSIFVNCQVRTTAVSQYAIRFVF